MAIFSKICVLALITAASLSYASPVVERATSALNTTDCNGKTYVYQQLAGWGLLAGNGTDDYGDTLGGIGSSLALKKGSWKKKGDQYVGEFWALPDRGWNTEGTLNFQPRVHRFKFTFTPNDAASVSKPGKPNLVLKYKDTIRLKDPKGKATTGLDPDFGDGTLKFKGFPDLPAATYTGDGFGGTGKGGHRVSLDTEGIVLNDDGTFWISDEYGPYVYKFDEDGVMIKAIRPVDAVIPLRNSTQRYTFSLDFSLRMQLKLLLTLEQLQRRLPTPL